MSKWNGCIYAAIGIVALLLFGATAATAQDQPKALIAELGEAPNPKDDSGKRPPNFSAETLAMAHEANRIAERANYIAEAQRSYALVQTVLAVLGVCFTALAAFAAIAAAIYAKRAAAAAGESAKADNEALAVTIQAAANAREDAAIQAERFRKQMAKTQEMVEFTAKSSYAMESSALATRRMADAMGRSAQASADAVEATKGQLALSRDAFINDQRPWVGVFEIAPKLLEIDENGQKLKVSLTLRNTGRTPAHDLEVKAHFIAEPIPRESIDNVKMHMGFRPREPESLEAVACVFPQQDFEFEFEIFGSPNELESFPTINGEKQIMFTLTGFVFYQSEVSGIRSVHATSFVYRIFRRGAQRLTLHTDDAYSRFEAGVLGAKQWPHGWLAD